MKQLFYPLLILLLFLPLTESFAQQAEELSSDEVKTFFLSTKPQALFFGVNLGAEYSSSSRSSWGADLTLHTRFAPANLAFSPFYKYAVMGTTSRGLYLKTKLVAGLYFSQTAVDDHPYYLGGGLLFGGMTPLFRSKVCYFFAECGLKYVAPFGRRVNSTIEEGSWGIAYYSIFSPASLPELSLGLAFKL